MELERRITNAKTISTPETATVREKPVTMVLDHPELKLMTKAVKEAYEKSEGECPPPDCRALYRPEPAEILINKIESPEEGAIALTHEFLHHLLTKLEGKEASDKFDTSLLGYYLDSYLFPDFVKCIFCEYYSPSSMFLGEGVCVKKSWKKVGPGGHCSDCKLSSVFKKLCLTDLKTWGDYQQGNIEKLLELARSKNRGVAEYYREEIERWRRFVRECPGQFNLECKHLTTDCFPDYCPSRYRVCPRFQKSKETGHDAQ